MLSLPKGNFNPENVMNVEVGYVFKDNYKRKLIEQYNQVTDKLYYIDILEYKQIYKDFIRKLNYLLINTSNMKKENYLQINDLLTSDEVIDRLHGLKKCREYIKIQ